MNFIQDGFIRFSNHIVYSSYESIYAQRAKYFQKKNSPSVQDGAAKHLEALLGGDVFEGLAVVIVAVVADLAVLSCRQRDIHGAHRLGLGAAARTGNPCCG